MSLKVKEFITDRLLPQLSISKPISYSRNEFYLDSATGSTVTSSNQKMSFFIPSDSIYDFSECALRFTASCSATGGTYARFSNGISTIIDRVVVRVSGTNLEELDEYGLIDQIFTNVDASNTYASTTGFVMAGLAPQATRNAWAAGKQYMINLRCASLQKMWPQPIMSQQLIVDIYPKAPSACVETDGTNPQWTISSPQLFMHQFLFSQSIDYKAVLKQKLAEAGSFQQSFVTWQHFTPLITSGGVSTVTVPIRQKSVRSFIGILRNQADITNPAVNDKFSTYNSQGLVTYQFKYNSSNIPTQPIDCAGSGGFGGPQHYYEILDTFRNIGMGYGIEQIDIILAQNIYTNKSVICYNFANANAPMAGIDLSTAYASLTINVNLGAFTANQAFEMYCFFDRQIILDMNGAIKTDD